MNDKNHGGRRKGAGRPLEEHTRRRRLTVRLSEVEWAALVARAKAAGVGVSAFVRKAALEVSR